METVRFRLLGVILSFVLTMAAFARPPVDKHELRKTAWVQLNPWFPVDMAPVYDLGGPNIPYKQYRGTNN